MPLQHEPVWRDAFAKEVQRDREYNTKVGWSAVRCSSSAASDALMHSFIQ